MARTEPAEKAGRIAIRISARQETLIRAAAAALGKSLTEFITDATCRAAEDALLDQRLFVVDAKTHERYARVVDMPADVVPTLADFLSALRK